MFSNYGNSPVAGAEITSVPVNVTGSNNRVYYSRPNPDVATNNMVSLLVSSGIYYALSGIHLLLRSLI